MPLNRLPNKYEEAANIDFNELETVFEGYVANTTKHVADAVTAIQSNVINQVKRRKILQNKDYRGAMTLNVNVAPIRAILLNSFMYIYLTGKHDAKKEIEAGLGKRLKFADIANIKPIEGMEQFRRKVPITKAEFTRMVGREKNKAFTVAGVVEADMVRNVQTLVDKAIDQGWGVNDLSFALKKANVEYTGTVYGTDTKKGQPFTAYHTETILRTHFADVYSRGREAMFNDPDVIEFLPAFMYSAILDSRVRESHAAMDGRIYERDDPIWSEWTPPNGYKCRCIKTPITSNQEFSVSTATKVLPDTGFGGLREMRAAV